MTNLDLLLIEHEYAKNSFSEFIDKFAKVKAQNRSHNVSLVCTYIFVFKNEIN